MIRPLLAATTALALAACGGAGDDAGQTGPNPNLPSRDQALIPTIRIATPGPWGQERPTVPAGFTISALATDLAIPRQMLALENGDLLVAEGRGGNAPALRPKDIIAGALMGRGTTGVEGGDRITLLRDANNDGVAEGRTVLVGGLNAPYGLAYVDGNLYVADQDRLLRFPFTPGTTRITAAPTVVTQLPAQINHHWTKALTASADGRFLYVGIGSNSNVGERGMEVEEERAVIWEVDRTTGARRTLVTGIRNPTALDINPQTNALWSVVNERDELGQHLVPDYLTQIRPGAFYGWPWSYYGQHEDPRPRPKRPDMVARAIAPDYALGSHVAALGLSFARNGGFGGPYGEGAFVGEHGSWNRRDLAGYKVAFVPFRGGRPAGPPRDFVTGFIGADGSARGRPVGVTFDGLRGALYVADDLSNTVWRVVAVAPVGQRALGAVNTQGTAR